jgi:ABC-2 type transport system ATP-binding protein
LLTGPQSPELDSFVPEPHSTPSKEFVDDVAALRGVVVRYGSFTALNGVSLSIRKGATGLIGRNGAGKSTLLRLLLGLVRPSTGGGHVLGCPLDRTGSEIRQSIGYMPENDSLVVGMNGLEQVVLAGELCGLTPRDAARRAHEALAYAGMDEARYRRVETYSAGMKQRLKLAAAIVHDPPLLLLDEPTVGLDPPGRRRMLTLIRDLVVRHGKSLVLCTHLLGDVEGCCDHLAVLDGGEILGAGPIADVKRAAPNGFRVSWEGSRRGFLDRLASDGVRTVGDEAGIGAEAEPSLHHASVQAPSGYDPSRLFVAAHETGATVWKLAPDEEALADFYHRLIGDRGRPLSHDG